jgi:hypothetical protein
LLIFVNTQKKIFFSTAGVLATEQARMGSGEELEFWRPEIRDGQVEFFPMTKTKHGVMPPGHKPHIDPVKTVDIETLSYNIDLAFSAMNPRPSLSDIEKKLKMSKPKIIDIRKGRRIPDAIELAAIAEYTGQEILFFYGLAPIKRPPKNS